jgi:hypothetical protein
VLDGRVRALIEVRVTFKRPTQQRQRRRLII